MVENLPDTNVGNIEYIRRQDAVSALADYIMNVDKVYSTGKLTQDDCIDCAESVLDDLSSADVAPVVHGKWIHKGCALFECNKCGEKVLTKVYVSEEVSDCFKFCPNCGAKMDREE